MARREYPVRVRCAHEAGCTKTTTYYTATRADEADTRQWQQKHPWKCTRHARPDQNLRPGNTTTRQVLVATRLPSSFPDRFPYNRQPPEERMWLKGLFWVPEGAATGSGFTCGPGFTAHADDFPEGTRLVVEARIEEPASAASPSPGGDQS